MILSGILMAVVFSFGTFTGALSFLGFVGILFFTAAFNFGFGSMVWVYASESFPAQLRTLGSSTMLTADLVANVIVASFFLSALTSLGGMVTFIIPWARLSHPAYQAAFLSSGHFAPFSQ